MMHLKKCLGLVIQVLSCYALLKSYTGIGKIIRKQKIPLFGTKKSDFGTKNQTLVQKSQTLVHFSHFGTFFTLWYIFLTLVHFNQTLVHFNQTLVHYIIPSYKNFKLWYIFSRMQYNFIKHWYGYYRIQNTIHFWSFTCQLYTIYSPIMYLNIPINSVYIDCLNFYHYTSLCLSISNFSQLTRINKYWYYLYIQKDYS